MGVAYGVTTKFQATKGIVQDGLVFNFDPAVKELYSGSGSSATALTGESISVNNSPSFTRADYGGNFTFDGTNSYLSVADSSENFTFANGNFSVGGWIGNVSSEAFVLTKGRTNTGGGWGLSHTGSLIKWSRYYQDSGWVYDQGLVVSHTLSDWTYILATCDASGAAGDMKLYANGSLKSLGSVTEIKTSVSNTFAIEIGRLNTYGYLQTYGENDSGPVHIYNRVLTAAEVSRNFNAMRYRFGI